MKYTTERAQTSLWARLIAVSMFCAAAVSFAAEGVWVRKTDMPTKRFGISMADVDGKLFVIGGSQANNRLATVEVYNPATDSWTTRADMPTARKNTAAAVVNGIIYVFGGTQTKLNGAITTTEAYDPATDIWTAKQDMPTARLGSAALPFQGKIYVIGGWGSHGVMESVVEVYDPLTDTWEDKAPLPVASGDFGYAGFNGKIYVFGGATTDTDTRATREYDPVTDRWTTKAVMPSSRIFPSATVLNGKIYVLGSSQDLASAAVKGNIYAIGGHTGITWDEPGTIYARVEEFALPAPAAPPLTIQKSVLLSWKASGSDYIVENASSAEGPWTHVTNSVSQTVGDEIHLTVIQTGAAQFFRLAVAP